MSKREQEDDARLIRAIQTGDGQAASLLWHRHAPMVVRMLRRNFGGSADVEDFVQDVFLVVFHKLRALRTPTSFKEFIMAITIHTCLEQHRRLGTRQLLPTAQSLTSDPEFVARTVEARIALSRFVAALGRLHPTYRIATMLRYLELRDLSDIASTLDISLATVKRRIARGSARVALLAKQDPFLTQYSVPDASEHAPDTRGAKLSGRRPRLARRHPLRDRPASFLRPPPSERRTVP